MSAAAGSFGRRRRLTHGCPARQHAAPWRIAACWTLLAVLLPTVVVAIAGADSVARVKDSGPIQPGIPAPALPDIHLLTYGMTTVPWLWRRAWLAPAR
jgi:hypothetical protein